MSEHEIDLRDRNRERVHQRSAGTTHQFRVLRYRGELLEVEDVHFHLDSAVMLPEPPDDLPRGANPERGRVGGLAVARACLLHARDNSSKRILVVGHTDPSGPMSHNLNLSRQRAENVLAVLQGDRNTFRTIAADQHRTSCVQQVLRWVAQTQGWDCDPGYVDDIMGRLTRGAIRTFQASYNEVHEASLAVDGIVGPNTWGAIYDLYESELELMLEHDQEDLAALRGNLQLVGAAPRGVGCGPHHTIATARQADYRSSLHRRVEILFFDPNMVPPLDCHPSERRCEPGQCVVYRPEVYGYVPIEVEPVPVRRWVSLQTVDELGHAAPNVELRIEPDLGEPIELTTDGQGFWSERILAEGSARITLGDGSPVVLGTSAPPNAAGRAQVSSGEEADVINLRASTNAVTDVIVPGLVSDEDLERARHLEDRYSRVPHGGVSSRRGETSRETEPETDVSSRGAEDPVPTTAKIQGMVADNLFLIASSDRGFDPGRLRQLFAEWVEDNHPEIHGRGYLLLMVSGNQIQATSSSGEDLGTFNFQPGLRAFGRFGAYADFAFPDTDRSYLLDLASESTSIDMYRGDEALGYTVVPDVVTEGDRLRTLIGAQAARRRFDTLYLVPGDFGVVVALALYGGSGRLENYSGRNTDRIHRRNLDLIDFCKAVYRAYLDRYIQDVEATTNEIELHALGPPRNFHQYPAPAGATRSQIVDIGSAQSETPLRAFRAISDKLREIWGQRPEGTFYVKCEFEINTGNVGGAYTQAVYKWNFEADLDSGRVYRGDEKRLVVHLDWPGRGQVAALIDPETGEITQKANLAVGPYGFEVQSNGSTKVSYRAISAETNYRTQDTFLGAEFSMKDLVERRWRQRNPGQEPPRWLSDMPDAKATIGIGFQGLRPGTVLNIVARSPGFFEMRTVEEMLIVDWNTLYWDESSALAELGWDQDTWDRKRRLPLSAYPESARSDYYDLTPAQKLALTRIPLRRFAADPYWRPFWSRLAARVVTAGGGTPSEA